MLTLLTFARPTHHT